MYFQTTKQILCGDYVRLSREDGDKLESDSIHNQKELIADYHQKHPELKHVQEYVDDGYSGTDFDRPGFKRMMDDAGRGKINCIIVKDACVIIEPTRKGPFERLSWPGSICF
ncbi:MAG: recombinase family protein [Lachnospiraceae bacterium]|nr:recombinase family protein [Lachnospiraceae bacterium]